MFYGNKLMPFKRNDETSVATKLIARLQFVNKNTAKQLG